MLVLNDFVLKSANLLPGFLTGKLSDFAGLMVFPVFMALILGRFGERRDVWTAIHVLVGAIFAAINLIPAASSAYVSALQGLGFHAQFWMDSTDLVALLALVVSYFVYPRLRPLWNLPMKTPIFRFATVAIAGFFCLSSSSTGAVSAPRTLVSYNGDLMVSDVAFINGTDSAISVQVEKYTGKAIDCHDSDSWKSLQDADHYASLGTFSQKVGEVTTLLPANPNDDQTSQCKAVRLTINNTDSVIVVWDPSETGIQERPIQEAMPMSRENLQANTIVLNRERKDYYFLAKGNFHVLYWDSPLYAVDYWKM